jgi:hypothetical protein
MATTATNSTKTTQKAVAPKKGAAATTTAKTAKTSVPQVEAALATVEKAILVPVGVTLLVRDDVVSTVKDIAGKYQAPGGLEKELKRYEKRGATARTRLERQVRKQRTKVEQDLRQRRAQFEVAIKDNRKLVETNIASFRKDLEKQSALVGEQLEKLVSSAQELATNAQGLIS